MKSILTVLAIAAGLLAVPLAVEAAPKYNERWQKIEEIRKAQVERHRAWVASASRSSQTNSIAPASSQKPVAANPKPVATTAAKKPVKRTKLASLSSKKRKKTSRRIGSNAQHLGRVEARIDLSEQKMRVYSGGRLRHVWPVSTARRGYRTPTGNFRPTRMHVEYYSRKYHNSPMPYSIFFHGGYAIHGTGAIKNLGRPASHGCVRLHPDNARTLFKMVERNGRANARITIRN